ncbi:hypothetical protein HOE67_04955, partial [Candidatus Peregrinibacteria bacterium]|nr:hypothetical protein [Candidatus Peregrinibacteria bacterium]
KNEKIIIAIGSAEKNFLPNNPLNAGERVQMIDETLKAEGIDPGRFLTIPIRNINNYALWVDHMNLYLPPYDTIYTGSQIVKACYEGSQSNKQLIQIKRVLPISATKIREAITNSTDTNSEWEALVPPHTAKLLKEMKIPQRLKDINETMNETKYK